MLKIRFVDSLFEMVHITMNRFNKHDPIWTLILFTAAKILTKV